LFQENKMHTISIIFLVTSLTFFLARIYKYSFTKFFKPKLVPTGFGLFIPVFLLLGLFLFNEKFIFRPEIISSSIVMIFSSIYYIDDLFYLAAWKRISLCVFTAISIVLAFNYYDSFSIYNISLFLIVFLTVLIEIFLANVLNFYDGADLNLAFILFSVGIILSNGDLSSNYFISTISLILIGFSIGFSFLNIYPKSIYLGDTGSFALSSLIVLILMIYLFQYSLIPYKLLIYLSFPACDVLYVLLIRLWFKHDLLSRNYLHLYQRIQIEKKNFLYLLPPGINYILAITLFNFLNKIMVNSFISTLLISFVFTPISYLSIRYLMVERRFFFGDGLNENSL
tara:strand:- start:1182 stop:2201 length:1020 start_codon:yes stop_codon:yes gene_type:complete